jgi:hypothetical protein
MASSGMLHSVALVRTDVSEKLSASIMRVTRIGELGTTSAITDDGGAKFLRNVGITKATRCIIREDGILHCHRRGNLKSYMVFMLYVVTLMQYSLVTASVQLQVQAADMLDNWDMEIFTTVNTPVGVSGLWLSSIM